MHFRKPRPPRRHVFLQTPVLATLDEVWEAEHGRYFQLAAPRCRTLFTTRETPVALSPEDSLQILSRPIPEAVAADQASARRLCDKLEYLPVPATSHSFTRNRTRGSDFPHFFSAYRKSQPLSPVTFVCFFGSRKGLLLVVGRVRPTGCATR